MAVLLFSTAWNMNFYTYNTHALIYEGWNVNSGNYLFTTDTK